MIYIDCLLNSFTCIQVTLGITTLLTYVPPYLGAAHQATALSLFTVALGLLHNLRPVFTSSSGIVRFATPLAFCGVLLVGAGVTATQ